MTIYTYKAKKGPSEIINGRIDADSQEEAVDKLNDMGLVPISVAETASAEVSVGPALPAAPRAEEFIPHATRLKTQEIDIFTQQLASLIKAGVPIMRALSLICQQAETSALRNVTGALERQIREGMMFSDALAQYPRIFNNLYINMVRSGERSGALDKVLYNLAQYREREQEIRLKIQAALAYPLLMVVVGMATVFVMLTFFLPKLIGLFENMKQALPLSTRILIRVSNLMAGNWHWFLIVLIPVVAVFWRTREGTKKKFLFDLAKLHLPFIKKFVMDIEIARFARTLSLLIKNGISVCEGLELATDVLDNDALKEPLRQARTDVVNEGCALSASLNKIDAFPRFVVNMISVGEEGGKLEESLTGIADIYEREIDQAIKIMTSLLEPLLILIIGAVVGFIVFAMLLPVFNIGAAVH